MFSNLHELVALVIDDAIAVAYDARQFPGDNENIKSRIRQTRQLLAMRQRDVEEARTLQRYFHHAWWGNRFLNRRVVNAPVWSWDRVLREASLYLDEAEKSLKPEQVA